jgi:hypothetical protein
MNLERRIAALFKMDEDTWQRHTNPWSGWSRLTALPILIPAVWSRVWLGKWALVPVGAALLWTWFNPRAFPRPRSTDNWMSKGVMGERVWLNRHDVPVPEHHRVLPNVLNAVSSAGTIFLVWGLIKRSVWSTLLGFAVIYLSKLWFIDRMVWLYDEMKEQVPEYRKWLY